MVFALGLLVFLYLEEVMAKVKITVDMNDLWPTDGCVANIIEEELRDRIRIEVKASIREHKKLYRFKVDQAVKEALQQLEVLAR
jgi:hypothetical protein